MVLVVGALWRGTAWAAQQISQTIEHAHAFERNFIDHFGYNSSIYILCVSSNMDFGVFFLGYFAFGICEHARARAFESIEI